MSFELIHKLTFTNQLLAIPREQVLPILEKIELLREDPKPKGNLKKKLHGYQGKVYRLRCGDYRIIYTYGDKWVSLLGVDNRKDVYRGHRLIAEPTLLDIHQLPNTEDILTPTPTFSVATQPTTNANSERLPVEINEDLLQQLAIPPDYFPPLLQCRTLDDLTLANIPDLVRDRVFDCITTPNFDQVLQQPNFVTGNTDDLLRFREGDLLGFLLKLNPEQEKYVTWALNSQGATLLKGGPGTGKSTVALYRVKAILESLKTQDSQTTPKILFTTYTNALIAFSQQLLENLLGESIQSVDVKTVDAIAVSLVKQATGDPNIAKTHEQKQLLQKALSTAIETLSGNKLKRHTQTQFLQNLSLDYLLQEINNLIEAREINTLEDYLATPRNGREIAFNKTQREAIWHLRDHFYTQLKEHSLETWEQLRNRALNILRSMDNPPIYDAVLVDEAQDLDPNSLRLLIQLCKAPNRLFITADANQSIYGNSFRWSDVHSHLKFVGRTGILRTNHRTTREINEAAHTYLIESILDNDPIERDYVYSGPPPAVRAVTDTLNEANLITHFCKTAAREFRLGISACAILVPTENAGKQLAQTLSYQGLPAHYMSSRDLDLKRDGVKIVTLKAAKGLEFPIVTIAGFLNTPFPFIPRDTPQSAHAEIYHREKRSLFVGMTRAMRALLIITPAENPSPLLQNFDPQLWNLGTKG